MGKARMVFFSNQYGASRVWYRVHTRTATPPSGIGFAHSCRPIPVGVESPPLGSLLMLVERQRRFTPGAVQIVPPPGTPLREKMELTPPHPAQMTAGPVSPSRTRHRLLDSLMRKIHPSEVAFTGTACIRCAVRASFRILNGLQMLQYTSSLWD